MKMFARSMLNIISLRATKRAVYVALIWTTLMMFCQFVSLLPDFAFLPSVIQLLKILGLVLVCMFVLDAIWLIWAVFAIKDISISRALDKNLPVHEHSQVTLRIFHDHLPVICQRLQISLMDYYPIQTQTHDLPLSFFAQDFINNSHETTNVVVLTYSLYAKERGRGSFGGVDWLFSTPLGLFCKFYHTPKNQVQDVQEVRILANFKDVLQGHLVTMSKHSASGGFVKRRRKGQGQDFHQIRSYVEGDSIRQIDWKATARYQRLMTKEYQDEADQEILFLLDCGQHMRHLRFVDEVAVNHVMSAEEDEHISHLDMALNAMLLLAKVANEQSDSVGFISFAGEKDKTVPPKKGANIISYLLNQSFDLTASIKAPDYMAVAREALVLQKRRSLIIIITNIRSANTDEIFAALQLLTQKHRVILVNLYEKDLQAYLKTLPDTLDEALTYHSVQSYLDEQKQLNARLGKESGALVIGVTPDELPVKLLDGYWWAKRWGVA